MRKRIGFMTAAVLAVISTTAVSQQSYEDFMKQDQAEQDAFSQQFLNEYNAYMEADRQAYESFKQQTERKWGDFIESSQKDWVEYSKDQSWRTQVDFETGQVKVEVILTPDQADARTVDKKIEEAVKALVTTRGTTKDYSTSMEKPVPLSPDPVLQGQVRTVSGRPVTSANASDFAREVVSSAQREQDRVKTAEGPKVKVTVNLSLVPDHAKVRAREYEASVRKYAGKYKVDPALVYAVIHTESSFNPKAKSHIPAYGLMQLVPKYAGRDAYKFIYNRDKVLNANYLYEADNNIELGVAYLHILQTRYFSGVQNEESRIYCTIAAYNTGAGNVARAFNGTTNIKKAIPGINKLSSQQVYRTMKQRLPYDETKNYLDRVSQRMEQYGK